MFSWFSLYDSGNFICPVVPITINLICYSHYFLLLFVIPSVCLSLFCLCLSLSVSFSISLYLSLSLRLNASVFPFFLLKSLEIKLLSVKLPPEAFVSLCKNLRKYFFHSQYYEERTIYLESSNQVQKQTQNYGINLHQIKQNNRRNCKLCGSGVPWSILNLDLMEELGALSVFSHHGNFSIRYWITICTMYMSDRVNCRRQLIMIHFVILIFNTSIAIHQNMFFFYFYWKCLPNSTILILHTLRKRSTVTLLLAYFPFLVIS